MQGVMVGVYKVYIVIKKREGELSLRESYDIYKRKVDCN